MLDTEMGEHLHSAAGVSQANLSSITFRGLQYLSPGISANSGTSCHRLTSSSAALLTVWHHFIF